MEKKRASAIMLALLLTSMLTLAFNIQPANAGTITVPDDYATIQGAINAASDGDTINVRAGTYYENVIINKKVSLVGEDRGTTIIDGSGNGNVVCMTSAADTANISSFTLRNGRGINDGAGIDVQSSSNHTITGNIITDNQRGLRLQFSRYNVICDNEITSNIETGIELRSSHWNSIFRNTASGNGLNIWIIGSSVNNIAGNEVADGDWGICLTESFNNTLRNNNMKQNRFNFAVQGARVQDYIHDIDFSNFVNGKAVYYMVGKKNLVIDTSVYPEVGYIGIVNCENMTVKNLNLEANAEGIKLVNTTGSLIKNLRINGVSAGISIEFGSCNNTVSKNVVLWCEMVGIYLHGSSCYNVIYENQVTCLNSGIRTLDSSDDNLVYHNTFFQYFPQQMSFGSTNTWDNGYPSGGNYWSDYTGVDLNSGPYQNITGNDGIGDTPYIIDPNNQDRYPLMIPYGAPPPPTYTLTVTATVGGTTDPAPRTYSYTANSTVQVTAIQNADYLFDYWELDDVNVGSANPYSVLMNKNHVLKAVFSPIPPPLSASISPLSVSILVGQSVTFTSTVSGGYTPYSYQWYLNGAPVSGATSASWTFTPTSSGIYYIHLKVTDAKGNTAQSDTARITVTAVPVGGYSFPIQVQTKTEPIIPYIALIAILTAIFTKLKPKTKRKR